MSYDEIYIGDHAFGKGSHKILLKDDARKEHCHIIGGTGAGKSKLMEQMIRQDIRNGKGVCLIDPHGNLYESILKWVVAHGFKHRLVVIDPNVKEWSVGLNFLEYDEELFDAGQHVENLIIEIGKARNENIFESVQTITWLRNFLQLAALQRLTFAEVYHLLNENNSALRNSLTERIKGDDELVWQLKEAWHEYDSAPARTRADMMKLPVWARVQTFRSTQTMRSIVGQTETTIDFYDAMEKGKVVLVNLHGKLSENERNLLGIIIIDKIYQAAVKRKPERGKLFYVYIDEFEYFVSERIAKALEELRKRRVSFILAHQELEQVIGRSIFDGKRLLASIMTNAKIKIAFRISRADAEAMALEMFGGFITGDEVKFEQKVTSFWPHKTRERSYARGSAMSESELSSVSNMIGHSSAELAGQVFIPGQGFMGMDRIASHSSLMSSGFSDVMGSSRGSVKGYSESEVEIDFPWYDLEPFEQVVSTTFYSIEEIKERYIQFLQNQADRFFHLRIIGQTDRPPIALKTPTVEEVRILPSLVQTAKLQSIKKHAKHATEIKKLLKSRRAELLRLQNGSEEKDEDLKFDQDTYEPRE